MNIGINKARVLFYELIPGMLVPLGAPLDKLQVIHVNYYTIKPKKASKYFGTPFNPKQGHPLS
jgi:hypothetical protein